MFTQREIVRVLSGGRESGNLARYLERNPLITNKWTPGPEIPFLVPALAGHAIGVGKKVRNAFWH